MVHLDFEKYDALGKELARAMFEGDSNQIVTSARELQNNVVRDLGGDFVDFACTHWIIANAEEIAGWSQKAREMIPEMDIGEPTRFIPGKNGEEEFPPIWVVPPDKSNEPLK